MKYKILVGGEDFTEYVPMPLSDQLALDKSLDQGFLKLSYTDKADCIRPFTSVDIEITDDFGHIRELSYFVASDNKTEIIAQKKFNHELLLIEQTKWLERFLVGNRTSTNPLVHDYLADAKDLIVEVYTGNTFTESFTTNKLKNIMETQKPTTGIIHSIVLPSPNDYKSWSGTMFYPTEINVYKDETLIFQGFYSNGYSFIPYKPASYRIEYVAQGELLAVKHILRFNIVDQIEPNPNKTITSVVNRILQVVETLRESETPRFVFDSTQAEFYKDIEAPEFAFGGTLWEVLEQVGEYIHSVPKLKGNVVSFEEFGKQDKVKADLSNYISNTERFDIEQFGNVIDSTIQNIVNTDNETSGSVVEPFDVGWITPRTDTGTVELTDTNCFIPTKEPIEKVVKLEVGYVNKKEHTNELVGDITPYVYESAEYATLSSYSRAFPLSKKYAIKYTTGQKNITGLTFRLPNALSESLEETSIISILEKVTGLNIKNLFIDEDIRDLQFRVTYVPMTEARLKQYKSRMQDNEFDSTLAYNQSATKISSVAYGEAMKGAIAKLGNPEITKMFLFTDVSLIPKVGQLYDEEYYISIVKCEYYKDFIKCEVGLSKNFNRISEYVGIKNEVRFYEISERNFTKCYINYNDFCIVGDALPGEFEYVKTQDYRWANKEYYYLFDNVYIFGIAPNIEGWWQKVVEKQLSQDVAIDSYKTYYEQVVDDAGTYFERVLPEGTESPVALGWFEDVDKMEKTTDATPKQKVYYLREDETISSYFDFEITTSVEIDGVVYYEINPNNLNLYEYLPKFEEKGTSLLQSYGLFKVVENFGGGRFEFGTKAPSAVKVTGYADGKAKKEVILPITKLAIGNSLAFTFKFDDNFSAGDKAGKQGKTKVQYQQEYADIWGELDSIDFDIGYIDQTGVFDFNFKTFDFAKKLGDSLPSTDLVGKLGTFRSTFATKGDKIVIMKDNREAPVFTYQLHFVTNNDKIVLGAGLTQTSQLVNDADTNYKLYILGEKVPKFAKFIDISKATEVGSISAGTGFDFGVLKINDMTANANGVAWAICQDDQLIMAGNVEVVEGEKIVLPTLTFVHKLN